MSLLPQVSPEQAAIEARVRAMRVPLEQARALRDRAAAGDREVLAARADTYSVEGQRVFLLAVGPSSLAETAAVWLAHADLEVLCAGPDAARSACCDAMFADPWQLVWCAGPGQLRLWNRRRLLLQAAGGMVDLPPGLLRRGRRLAVEELHHVQGRLGQDWVRRGIDLVPRQGPPLTLVSRRELAAMLSPTYDALELLCDASWVRDLSRALGEALGLPVELDPDL